MSIVTAGRGETTPHPPKIKPQGGFFLLDRKGKRKECPMFDAYCALGYCKTTVANWSVFPHCLHCPGLGPILLLTWPHGHCSFVERGYAFYPLYWYSAKPVTGYYSGESQLLVARRFLTAKTFDFSHTCSASLPTIPFHIKHSPY